MSGYEVGMKVYEEDSCFKSLIETLRFNGKDGAVYLYI